MNCTDCGIRVTYNDAGFVPWLGIDGSDTCPRQGPRSYPHRLYNEDAAKMYAAFELVTGQKARHAR